jgi:hypothetical protein
VAAPAKGPLTILAAFAALSASATASAEPGPTVPPAATVAGRPFWVGGGLGWTAVGSAGGIAARAEASMGLPRGTLALGVINASELGWTGGQSQPQLSNTELSLRYGWLGRFPGFSASISAGPAAVWTTRRGSFLMDEFTFGGVVHHYETLKKLTWGGTVEGGVGLSSRHVWFGPAAHATIDPVQSSLAILLDLRFGFMGEP